jgi:protein-S-isoprenylcysteine O-methyltransferase Ste14
MKRAFVATLFLLLVISIAAPSLAFAQELIPTPEMVAPVAMVSFGLLGLIGGSAAYAWRHRRGTRPERSPEL